MYVTVSIDDATLARAQEFARRRGITVEEMITRYLHELAVRPARSPEEVVAELKKFWASHSGDSGGVRWTREEIHERSGIR
jgi:hypothetical protein